MSLEILNVANNAESTLDGAITDSATSLDVQTGDASLFPSANFHVTLVDANDSSSYEIVKVTNVASDTFTVTRAQESTTAKAFDDGAIVAQYVTAQNITNLNNKTAVLDDSGTALELVLNDGSAAGDPLIKFWGATNTGLLTWDDSEGELKLDADLVLDAASAKLTLGDGTAADPSVEFSGSGNNGSIIYDESDEIFDVKIPSASFVGLYVGDADTVRGRVRVRGHATGTNEGGQIWVDTSADHDGTIGYYVFQAHNDDLRIGPSTDENSLTYDGGNDQWNFTGANGVLIDNDLQVDGDIGVTGDTNLIQLSSGAATVDGTFKATDRVTVEKDGGLAEIYFDGYRDSSTQTMLHARARRGSKSTPTVVSDNDLLFRLRTSGYDGSGLIDAAEIHFQVDGTPATNVMYGRIEFLVNNGGASASEALRIDNDKRIVCTGALDIATHTPSSASDTGTAGHFAWDGSYLYICTASNTWKRVSVATW